MVPPRTPSFDATRVRAVRGGAEPSPTPLSLSHCAAMRITVCLPTYNEIENLERMVHALGDVLPEGAQVLVIDDGSPDGTGALADRLAAELSWVAVLHRERKEGLGRAYIAGFLRALADGAELVLEMDCDFSHDPRDVPRLIAAVEDGADVAIGSRYVPGGGTENWGLVRRMISRFGSLYTRMLLMPVRDPTSGFKCFRREVPITFAERTIGHSKMSRTIVLEAIWKVPALRLAAARGTL